VSTKLIALKTKTNFPSPFLPKSVIYRDLNDYMTPWDAYFYFSIYLDFEINWYKRFRF